MARIVIEEERLKSWGDTEQCWLAGFDEDTDSSDLVSVFDQNEIKTDDYE
jgi:hypothetical protein